MNSTISPMPLTETRNRRASRVFVFTVAAASLVLFLSSSNAQTSRKAVAAAAAEDQSGAFKEYRGVQLGMLADEVRKKLGTPKDKGDEQDFFVFGETETAQIVYDQTHKVITISADYLTAAADVPTAKTVFGSDVEAKADGSVYRMVRFPKAGYWVSYNRTSGATPMTSITLQKIQ
ncbi:MAG TPA: hypothetical protein VGW76_14015 [Pyrinomonadaceae bacterium]|nr:hypothetical protein [Pyrinomonadaceae bacterium]